MARLANLSREEEDEDEPHTTARPVRRAQGRVNDMESPSPTASFSSDKENHTANTVHSRRNAKSKAILSPQLPTPTSADPEAPSSNKKRRVGEHDAPNASQALHERKLAEAGDTAYYDPNQNMNERRAVRKDFRDLSKELTDSRAEYLTSNSDGLVRTLNKANELFASVKQTSDATLDSRLLVSTADLSAKRTTQLNLGDSTTGIDVDDFVGKCITYMRRGSGDGRSSTQQRRVHNDSDDEEVAGEGFDEGDAFDWELLGRRACFPNNVRPPVPGFLLGPLSVQKRIRKATQRREPVRKRDPRDAVRPEELKAQDLEKVENSNLTAICTTIHQLLRKTMSTAQEKVEQEYREDMTEDETRALMAKHMVPDDGGVPFFHFVVNPKSFGQTVENIFYISFLVKEGTVGLGSDSNMLPTLHVTEARNPQEVQAGNISKHQAVFHLDFETWEDMIEAFEIKESMIPHRKSEGNTQVSESGWYG